MKLTKYGHACAVLTKDNESIVIDPGEWSPDFVAPENPVAAIVTHVHADHFDKTALAGLLEKNPNLTIFTTAEVAEALDNNPHVQIVTGGQSFTIGGFTLDFFGGQHAQIHPSYPLAQNVGVLIDKTVYYPGDSFALPNPPVNVLLTPVSAPWLKFSESIDFVMAVKPQLVVPTHDAILSDVGKALIDRMLSATAEAAGGRYERLTPDEPIII